jgi:hypothetical protein
LLQRVLGERFLTPLEASDRVIRLDMQDARASQLMRNALEGVATPATSVDSYVYIDVDVPAQAGDTQIVTLPMLQSIKQDVFHRSRAY